jgi:hypothetical protein
LELLLARSLEPWLGHLMVRLLVLPTGQLLVLPREQQKVSLWGPQSVLPLEYVMELQSGQPMAQQLVHALELQLVHVLVLQWESPLELQLEFLLECRSD